jgi:hypothetical protein
MMRDQLEGMEEIQIFTRNNGNSPPTSTILPYSFDNECGLVINDNFYTPSPLFGNDMSLDPFEDLELELKMGSSFEKMKEEVEEDIIKIEPSETGSVISTEASGPIMTRFNVPMESIRTLDEQLDFIMETTKKHQKPREKSHRRNRKTPEQLKILIDDLGDVQNADKAQIRAVAEKTGLTDLQVYKWYWDRKSKN